MTNNEYENTVKVKKLLNLLEDIVQYLIFKKFINSYSWDYVYTTTDDDGHLEYCYPELSYISTEINRKMVKMGKVKNYHEHKL